MGSTMTDVKSHERGHPWIAFGAGVSELGKTDRLDLEDNAGAAMHAIAGSLPDQRVVLATLLIRTSLILHL